FPHGGGDIRNTVRDSTISGEISLRHSDITSNTIEGNRCQFIGDSSTFAFTIIRGNVVETAIADASGGPGGGIEDEIIEDNVVLDGFIASSGASVTIRRNVVTATTLTVLSDLANAGIFTNSGDPTNIVGNTVTIPSATPTTPLCDFDDPVVLRTSAGRGLVADNLFTGGACGIADSSGGDYIGNTIRGTHHGVITSGGYIWRDNVIVGNSGDGMITQGGPLEGNVIRDNAGAGVRLLYPVDTGAGPFASFGGNTIRGNGACDLVVDAGVDTAAVVFTRNNAWDHATEAEVRALDVRDERPGATPDLIVIAPLACFGRLDLVIEGTVTDQDAGDVVVCLRGRAEV
ncbi:MAG: DUF1565 domain-containing protein, partial [Myxococcales bacterium]|nr:DUF1565 domain-containing protein [Myxococcales bacterium]